VSSVTAFFLAWIAAGALCGALYRPSMLRARGIYPDAADVVDGAVAGAAAGMVFAVAFLFAIGLLRNLI
jgi:hypothetical protein